MITHLSQFHANTLLPTDATFRAWLYRIAHNLLVDHYRKTGRQPELALEQAEGLAGEHHSLARSVEQKLLFEQAQAALHQLSQEYQDVLILRFIVGLSLQEVAQVLGKNLAVVKITQHRGLEKLRVVLAAAASEA
jgi:RNA polymerase sigma-70 factor (ECF subfamily)